MPAYDPELVAPGTHLVELSDLPGEDGGVVVRKDVAERAKSDSSRQLRAGRPKRERIGGDRKARKEEVFDHRVRVESDAIGVDDLFDHLAVPAGEGSCQENSGAQSRR